MIPVAIAALACMIGYAVVVATSFVFTLGFTSAMPRFVAQTGRLNASYLVIHAAIWLLCSLAGGFATGTLAGSWHPPLAAGLLAVSLVAVNWLNDGDTTRQDGLTYRLLLSVITLVGVAAGYTLRLR